MSISLILVSGHSVGSVWSAALSIHWCIVFFDELAVFAKSLILVSPALGDDLYHLRSNNTTLAKWFQYVSINNAVMHAAKAKAM